MSTRMYLRFRSFAWLTWKQKDTVYSRHRQLEQREDLEQ
jgi:hypothetical protein